MGKTYRKGDYYSNKAFKDHAFKKTKHIKKLLKKNNKSSIPINNIVETNDVFDNIDVNNIINLETNVDDGKKE